MNIIGEFQKYMSYMLGILVLSAGAGIYVFRAVSSNTGNTSGVQGNQPTNSYAVADTKYCSISSYQRFRMLCCSNLSSPANGSFTFPNGYTASSIYNYGNAFIRKQTITGCYDLYYFYNVNYYFTLSHSGVYTCSIADSNGNIINIHIGVYEEGFNSKHNVS